MLNITTNNWHNVCRRLETQSEMLAKQQVGGEISAIVKRFSKTPNSYKEKSSKFYAILKTTNIRLLTVNENSFAQSLWEAEAFLIYFFIRYGLIFVARFEYL